MKPAPMQPGLMQPAPTKLELMKPAPQKPTAMAAQRFAPLPKRIIHPHAAQPIDHAPVCQAVKSSAASRHNLPGR
jgi:hypothetical protein